MDDAIIAGANIFHETFNVLSTKLNRGVEVQDKKAMGLIVSTSTNGVFACELYMKAMLSNPPHEHKLDKLFEDLDSDVQTFIEKIMVSQGKHKDNSYDEEKFREELQLYGNAFVEWRYFFEYGPKININFIKDLLAVLKATVKAKREGVNLEGVDFSILS